MKPMKIITLLLLSAFCAQGQLSIYKTSGVETVIAAGKTIKLTVHGYMVLDLFNGTGTSIGAFTLNHEKKYVSVPMQNFVFSQASGASGTVDVLAKAATPGDQPNSVLESSFMMGKEVEVNITPLGSLRIPRSFTTLAQNISNPNGIGVVGVAHGTGSLDISGSMTANTNGETLDAAVNRLRLHLQSLGYVDATPL